MSTTILIVDDSEDDRLLYQNTIKELDASFCLSMASSASEGFDCAANIQPDLILLDYNMPDMDGLEFMKKLATHTETPIPIIMLTGEDNLELAVEAMKHGADDFLVKDFKGQHLRKLPGVIARVMAANLQRKENQRLQNETRTLLLRNQLLMHHSLDGIHVMNMQGDIIEANGAFCSMMGYTQAEMAHLNVADWELQWPAEELRERFKKVIGKSTQFETVHRRKDGSQINVEISASGIEIENELFIFAISRDISQRKKAEDAVRESERKFRLLFESAGDCIMVLDDDGCITDINRTGHERLGYSKEEMVGKPIARFDAPEFANKVSDRIAGIRKNGVATFESAHVRKDGLVMPVEVNCRTVDHNGPHTLLSIIRDVSERKNAELALKQSEANLRAMLDNSPYMSWLKDTEGRYIMINKVLANQIRIKDPGEAIGKSDLDFQPKELAEKYRADDFDVMEKRQRKHVEEPGTDGTNTYWVETYKTPIVDNLGRVLGTVGFACDISERKQKEQALLESEARLGKALHQLDAHMINSPLAVIEFDQEYRVTRWSKSAEQIFGWKEPEILGRAIAELRWVHEEDVGIVQRIGAEMFSGISSSNMCANRNYRKDGTVIHAVWYNSALYDENGKMVSILSQVLDVSERDQALLELSLAKSEAERANRAKSIFLANMSHEIRTPLNVISGLCDLLEHDIANPMQKHKLEQLRANSDHLLALVNDILDLSRIEAGGVVLDSTDFRLCSVIERVMNVIAVPAKEKDLNLMVNVEPELSEISLLGSPLRLEQILINLLCNAVKFTEHGTVRLNVACLAQEESCARLKFVVEDTGIGISEADHERLFKVFTQLDDSRTRANSGSGLGLAISQRLAELMGSKIEIESQPGVGSRFSFEISLPRVPSITETPVETVNDLTGFHVLFAEDHQLSQDILFEMLDNLGCEVDVASDGVEALLCAQLRSYDLILLDMQMPKMDGLEAAREIRKIPMHSNTPIVALTANAYEEDRKLCFDAGMNGHISKPVSSYTLATSLSKWFPELAAISVEDQIGNEALELDSIPGLDDQCALRKNTDYCELLKRFVIAHCDDMARICLRLDEGDFEEAHIIAHNLKGIAGLLGVQNISALAGELTQQLKLRADKSLIKNIAEACEAELFNFKDAIWNKSNQGAKIFVS